MNRIINTPSSIEFDEAFIVMARYKDVGWDCVKIAGTREEAVEKLKELNDEFDDDSLIMRKVKLTTDSDLTLGEIKNKLWFRYEE